MTKVSSASWKKWQEDDDFTRVFGIVKSPVALTYNMYQAIALKAAVEHLKLLDDPNKKVRMWAIERAQNLAMTLGRNSVKEPSAHLQLSMAEVRELIQSSTSELSEADKRLLTRGPFDVVDAESRVIDDNTNRSRPRFTTSAE